jgi:hypothetical protein
MYANEYGTANSVLPERIMKAWTLYLVELEDIQMLLDRSL